MVALGSPEMAVRVPSEGFGRGRPLAQEEDALCFDAERGLNAGPYMYDENHGKILALAGELQLPVGSASELACSAFRGSSWTRPCCGARPRPSCSIRSGLRFHLHHVRLDGVTRRRDPDTRVREDRRLAEARRVGTPRQLRVRLEVLVRRGDLCLVGETARGVSRLPAGGDKAARL